MEPGRAPSSVREVRVRDFAGWRAAARTLLRERIEPGTVLWRADDDAQLALGGVVETMDASPASRSAEIRAVVRRMDAARPAAPLHTDVGGGPPAPGDGPRVPRRFLVLAGLVAHHRAADRWALLYRVLWRIAHGEAHLMEVAVDPDVHRLLRYEKAVRRDVHKTHAFVRFREVMRAEVAHYVAWFVPEQDTLALSAPFFARRFPNMPWSILGPRECAHWDGERLSFSTGVPREAAPAGDALEALWRTYYASIFNPARPKPAAMRAEMPRRVWHLLPEAALLPELIADAPRRVRRMLEAEARPPKGRDR